MSAAQVVASEERAMFLEGVQALARVKIAPLASSIDEDDAIPADLVCVLADSELLHVDGPITVGGAGGDLATAIASIEVLAQSSGAVAVLAAASHTFAAACRVGEESAWECLPGVAAGRWPAVVGFHERTFRANRTSGGFELLGEARVAEGVEDNGRLLVLATTDSGSPIALRVAAGAVRLGPSRRRTGLRGISRRTVELSGVRVTDEAVRGGTASVVAARNYRALAAGAITLGLARAAIREARTYLQERRQFGGPLWRFGGLRAMVEQMEDEVACAAGLVNAAAGDPAALTGAAWPTVDRAARMAATASVDVCKTGVQLHGGYGYTTEFAVERLMRDAISARARLAVAGSG
jgi:alkylation response protein AidB-like acyl-CoA dehydrogenase